MNSEREMLQVRMSGQAKIEIQKLQENLGFSTMAEVMKVSVSLLKWLVEKRSNGYDIYAIPKNEDKAGEKIELVLPI